jgi:pantoate--beta-alanine ligase
MNTITTIADMRAARAAHGGTTRVGLVPTMGAFHAGHEALFRVARRECEVVIASLFVNPSQFNDPADLAAYPRDAERDAATAARAGVDLLFAPSVEEMYGPHYATWVEPGGASRGLEGEARPGHFRGVATVCLKLFQIVRPDVAYFGQKDAQQVAVVSQMVRDLNVDLVIRVVPTVRDADGLALSSRNVRLSPADRVRAAAIPRALEVGLAAGRAGKDPAAAAQAALGDIPTDYVRVVDLDGHLMLAIAVRLSGTRLIDNVRLDEGPAEGIVGLQEAAHGK